MLRGGSVVGLGIGRYGPGRLHGGGGGKKKLANPFWLDTNPFSHDGKVRPVAHRSKRVGDAAQHVACYA